MKELIGKLLPGLIVAAFGILLTNLLNRSKENSASSIHYLDNFTNIDFNQLSKSDLEKNHFEILYNGQPVYNITDISVQLYNFNEENFSEIPIYVEIIPKEGDSLTLINSDAVGENDLYENVSVTKETLKPAKEGNLKFGYILGTANKSDTAARRIFAAKYSIISNEKPDVKVSIKKVGLGITNYLPEHFYKLKWWETDLGAVCIG